MTTRRKVDQLLAEARRQLLTGEITFRFEEGVIVGVRQSNSIKVDAAYSTDGGSAADGRTDQFESAEA